MKNPPKLSVKIGCPFALLLAAVVVVAVEAARSTMDASQFTLSWWSCLMLVQVAIPFGVIAVARTSDWLAWSLALAGTAALWGWVLYDRALGHGFNFALGPILLLAPLLISGLSLTAAGVRGRIPDWGAETE